MNEALNELALSQIGLKETDYSFEGKLISYGLYPLNPGPLQILQVNVGKLCNQTCKHCHVDAGPHRREMMTTETFEKCLEAAIKFNIQIVDITGGAPELNPNFRWFVKELSALGKHIMVRCNLTVILANKKYSDLPDFFALHKVEVISSLPHYQKDRTDKQRGEGVFDKSIKALQMLNNVGYGHNKELLLNLVYNPNGAFLPGKQQDLEADFKKALKNLYNIDFNNLYVITNIPINRFLDFLIQSGNYNGYMEKLVNAFNPDAVSGLMCKNTLSVSWDGYLYDCDFNQMLDLKIGSPPMHVSNISYGELGSRSIITGPHCFGCTAGAGSSCGGALVP